MQGCLLMFFIVEQFIVFKPDIWWHFTVKWLCSPKEKILPCSSDNANIGNNLINVSSRVRPWQRSEHGSLMGRWLALLPCSPLCKGKVCLLFGRVKMWFILTVSWWGVLPITISPDWAYRLRWPLLAQGKQNICITWCSKAFSAGGSISTPEGITEAFTCLEIPESKVQGPNERKGETQNETWCYGINVPKINVW